MPEAPMKILLVDDEPIKRSVMEDELREAGYLTTVAANPIEAAPLMDQDDFDVVLTDLRMPGQDGLAFLEQIHERHEAVAVIVMTAYGTVESAVEAMRLGAYDYLEKPFATEELLLKLEQLRQQQRQASPAPPASPRMVAKGGQTQIIGQSKPVRQVLAQIHAIAGIDTTVLLHGESGTGKELVARTIHESSHRAGGPMVSISCASMPASLLEAELFGYERGAFTGATRQRLGRFELANGGTLLLDDVDDFPLEAQVKLLRVLQEQVFERIGGEKSIRTNVRVIAATKKDLSVLATTGQFREDLYYRLNVVPLDLPPLRDRREDIPLLVDHFLKKIALKLNRNRLSMSAKAQTILREYPWPGNVRQLENYIERMVALSRSDELGERDVPPLEPVENGSRDVLAVDLSAADKVDLAETLKDVEGRLVNWALGRANNNLMRAAQMLGVPRSTLQYKVEKLRTAEKIDPGDRE